MLKFCALPLALAILAVTPAASDARDGVVSTRSPAFDVNQFWTGDFGVLNSQSRIPAGLTVPDRKPLPKAGRSGRRIVLTGPDKAAQLKSLIAGAEVGHLGYDAIQHGARLRPAKRPTQMTLQEILYWITTTPGQPHAIGRYQIIPATLRSLIHRTGLSLDTPFDAATQDRFASLLLHDAGYNTFMSGGLKREAFMDNLAAIWAGLPTSNGRSAYHGYAGNAATISRADYARYMAAIFD